jgi:transcriptional regulator with XRE-family HTH domain
LSKPAISYDCFVSQDQRADGFADYLRRAIEAAGFPTVSQFARAAGVEPSVVFAWLDGRRRPTIRLLERIAPVLGLDTNELVAAAYPEASKGPRPVAPMPRKLHPMADEVDRQLDPGSPLNDDERQRLIVVVEAGLAPGRLKMRPRRRRAG